MFIRNILLICKHLISYRSKSFPPRLVTFGDSQFRWHLDRWQKLEFDRAWSFLDFDFPCCQIMIDFVTPSKSRDMNHMTRLITYDSYAMSHVCWYFAKTDFIQNNSVWSFSAHRKYLFDFHLAEISHVTFRNHVTAVKWCAIWCRSYHVTNHW